MFTFSKNGGHPATAKTYKRITHHHITKHSPVSQRDSKIDSIEDSKGPCSHFQKTEEVPKICCWAPLILWTNDQRRCSERQICPFKKVNHLCSCIEHLLPLHLWTQQRRCLKSEHLLPYIYEHNRGGASSQSCTDTEAKNITIHHQCWTPPPLVWIYIHNRGAWIFLLNRFAFLSTSSGQLCSQNQRCSTKNLKQRWLRFFVKHLFCVHKCKGVLNAKS